MRKTCIGIFCPKTTQDMNAKSWDTAPPTPPTPPKPPRPLGQRLQFCLWTNEYQLYSKNWWLKTEKACNTNLKYLTLHSWSKKHDDCFVRFCCWWWQVWNSFKKEIEIVFGVNNGWKWRKAALHVTRPRPQDHTTAMFEVWPNMKYTWRRAPRMI